MAIILDIAPELEEAVQNVAAKQGMTPDTVPLYHPRQHNWHEHFAWN